MLNNAVDIIVIVTEESNNKEWKSDRMTGRREKKIL